MAVAQRVAVPLRRQAGFVEVVIGLRRDDGRSRHRHFSRPDHAADDIRADLAVLVEGDKALFNQYGVMVVNPAKFAHVKAVDAQKFVDWVISPAGQDVIASYKIDGQQLFFPNATR